MSDLIRILYQYACEYRVTAYLLDGDWEKLSEGLEKREAALAEALPSKERLSFSYYCDENRLHQELEREAAFQAGFAMALELAKL